ncbi:PQQ-binding-like beta-propeller repeat protein [uncultured Clostridium sp.]|uniref:outer membrane protein assembly factor BamB family protein n=1 Tax=uncultured Clostridium sp. TaxID=59620 RepID=UPI002601BFD6|nr:PQQ-binding-like beta-propeller repeat protein [uncultured Clostridium sp.]
MKKYTISLIIFTTFMSLVSCSANTNTPNKVEETVVETVPVSPKHEFKKLSLPYLSSKNFAYKNINSLKKKSDTLFTDTYSDIEGVFTFRGNNFRNSPSFGISSITNNSLKEKWKFKTDFSSWGGGAGWTGQPALIKWPKELKEKMNLSKSFKEKADGIEAIYASLDGNIYFLDAQTGEQTRKKINVGNPIKGSISIDPRGLPLRYVGEGINETSSIGFNIFSLIDGKRLYKLPGNDIDAPRAWGAFDSSCIIDAKNDIVFAPAENGLIYKIKLNSNYNIEKNTISINPKIEKYRYNLGSKPGIESSIATYSNLGYFADNNGFAQCIDLDTMKPIWKLDLSDDTDATLTLDIENDIPYLYAGNEVDMQGSLGYSKIKKIDGLTGKVSWEKSFKCESLLGSSPVNGGLLSTPVMGKNSISNLAIFSLSRYDGFNSGLLVALDKSNGDIIWEKKLPNYAWSSPVDFYDKDGNGFIILGDSSGTLHLIDGASGNTLTTLNLDANIEASPAIFEDFLVIATRNGSIYGIEIQ